MQMARKALAQFVHKGEDFALNYIEDLAVERFCGDLQPHAVFPDGSFVVLYPKAKKIEFTYVDGTGVHHQYRSLVNV